MVITVFMDAHTLVVCCGRAVYFYPNFLGILKAVGPNLKTIRFEITEKIESSWDYERKWRKILLEHAEDLAAYRFEISLVESAIVSGSRQQYSMGIVLPSSLKAVRPHRGGTMVAAVQEPILPQSCHRLENSVLCNFRNVCRVHSWKTNKILHIDEAPDPMNTLGNKMGSGPVRLDDTRTSWTTPHHELTRQCSTPAHRVVDTDVCLIPRHDIRKPLFGYCQQKGVTKIEFVNCTTFGEFIYKEVRI